MQLYFVASVFSVSFCTRHENIGTGTRFHLFDLLLVLFVLNMFDTRSHSGSKIPHKPWAQSIGSYYYDLSARSNQHHSNGAHKLKIKFNNFRPIIDTPCFWFKIIRINEFGTIEKNSYFIFSMENNETQY